jgi:hypothetical protein
MVVSTVNQVLSGNQVAQQAGLTPNALTAAFKACNAPVAGSNQCS